MYGGYSTISTPAYIVNGGRVPSESTKKYLNIWKCPVSLSASSPILPWLCCVSIVMMPPWLTILHIAMIMTPIIIIIPLHPQLTAPHPPALLQLSGLMLLKWTYIPSFGSGFIQNHHEGRLQYMPGCSRKVLGGYWVADRGGLGSSFFLEYWDFCIKYNGQVWHSWRSAGDAARSSGRQCVGQHWYAPPTPGAPGPCAAERYCTTRGVLARWHVPGVYTCLGGGGMGAIFELITLDHAKNE